MSHTCRLQIAVYAFSSNNASFACWLVHSWATLVNEQDAASACCDACLHPLILLTGQICCIMSAAGSTQIECLGHC